MSRYKRKAHINPEVAAVAVTQRPPPQRPPVNVKGRLERIHGLLTRGKHLKAEIELRNLLDILDREQPD